MGAGASAASMPIEQRRELYEDLRNKYTRNDLDALAEEEKQAWLEVFDGQGGGGGSAIFAETSPTLAAADETVTIERVAPEADGEGEGEAGDGTAAIAAGPPPSPGQRDLSITAPEVTVRQAAEAAAALTGASSGRKSGWDLSGEGDTGVRPQGKNTRLSFLLASESKDDGEGEDSGDAGRGGGSEGGEGGDDAPAAGDGAGVGASGGGRCRQEPARSKRASAELPAWKKAAEELETPNELCVGDVVRARDKECNGMWFEGVLTAIHDETTFEVELSTDEEEGAEGGSPQRVTVGIEDVVRVMPWFCIEVGDMVECQPEGTMNWVRGTVVNIALAQAMYDVALESEFEDESDTHQGEGDNAGKDSGGDANGDSEHRDRSTRGEGEKEEKHQVHRVPDCRIRKIVSGRQAAARRWKKVYLASCITSNIGRLIGGKGASSDDAED